MIVTIKKRGMNPMLKLCNLGIAFAFVFYFVFGIAVRLMALTEAKRNSARLAIVISSVSIVMISSFFAGILNLRVGICLTGILSLILSAVAFFVLTSIVIELYNIHTRIKMRRFMVLFDIVDKLINEGKTTEEILNYLTGIQKLTKKEASDFLDFITDPDNHQFLAEVNEKIQEAKLLGHLPNNI